MKKATLFSSAMLAILFSVAFAAGAQTKDINLGWSGQGSWTTLPYVVAKENGLFEREGLLCLPVSWITPPSCRFLPAHPRAGCQ